MLFYIFCCVRKGLACCWPCDIMLSCSSSYFITSFSWFSCVQFDLGWIKCMCNIIGILVHSSNRRTPEQNDVHYESEWLEPLRTLFPLKLVSFTRRVRVSREIFDWPCLPWQHIVFNRIIEYSSLRDFGA